MLSTLVLASMITAQQADQPTEVGVRSDYMWQKVDSAIVKPGDPVKLYVHISDVDVSVYKNTSTGKLRAEPFYAGGDHSILIDPDNRGAQAGVGVPYITHDQIIYKNVGWDKDKQWYTYEVTVFIPEELQKDGATFAVALEIRDTAPAPWERDQPAYCGASISFRSGT